MDQITVTNDVVLPDGDIQVINAKLTADGCTLSGTVAEEYSISWEQMIDVEQLSEMFANETVRTFKAVVMLLGKVYMLKDACKLLS